MDWDGCPINFLIWGGMDLDPTKWGGLELGLNICPVKTSISGYRYLQYYWADLAQNCSLGPLAMSRILSLRLIHVMHALTSNI